jgi:cell division protein FtsB
VKEQELIVAEKATKAFQTSAQAASGVSSKLEAVEKERARLKAEKMELEAQVKKLATTNKDGAKQVEEAAGNLEGCSSPT